MNGSPLYARLLTDLKENAEADYAAFHKRLLKNESVNVLGVRVPTLRKLAKLYKNDLPELINLPDEYYEVTFIKLQAVSLLEYEQFIKYVDKCVSLIDNWATCDCFAPKCIAKHKDEFLSFVGAYIDSNREFTQRFALTTLLHFYVEEEYLQTIYTAVREKADTKLYYVHMAAAWLIAEVLVKYYESGVQFLKANALDIKTHNKAIQKACESFRPSKEQKEYLKTLKR